MSSIPGLVKSFEIKIIENITFVIKINRKKYCLFVYCSLLQSIRCPFVSKNLHSLNLGFCCILLISEHL